jgi:hypothetical protein
MPHGVSRHWCAVPGDAERRGDSTGQHGTRRYAGNIVACNGRVGFRVLTVFDSTTLTTTVLPAQAESFFLVEGNTVVFRTFEGPEATDLNADADLDDRIVQYQAF